MYKTILYQAIMYVIPNVLLLVLTIFLIQALIQSRKLRDRMKGGKLQTKTLQMDM